MSFLLAQWIWGLELRSPGSAASPHYPLCHLAGPRFYSDIIRSFALQNTARYGGTYLKTQHPEKKRSVTCVLKANHDFIRPVLAT